MDKPYATVLELYRLLLNPALRPAYDAMRERAEKAPAPPAARARGRGARGGRSREFSHLDPLWIESQQRPKLTGAGRAEAQVHVVIYTMRSTFLLYRSCFRHAVVLLEWTRAWHADGQVRRTRAKQQRQAHVCLSSMTATNRNPRAEMAPSILSPAAPPATSPPGALPSPPPQVYFPTADLTADELIATVSDFTRAPAFPSPTALCELFIISILENRHSVWGRMTQKRRIAPPTAASPPPPPPLRRSSASCSLRRARISASRSSGSSR